jgi:outer membrane immunogenic protein
MTASSTRPFSSPRSCRRATAGTPPSRCAPASPAFVYGKLGAVWGKFDHDSHFIDGSFSGSATGNATITGVLIGVGFEYALTDNWTTKFEYNYIDYGNKIVEFLATECDPGGCASDTFRQTVKERKQLAKLGINYKFGVGKEPVVRARY